MAAPRKYPEEQRVEGFDGEHLVSDAAAEGFHADHTVRVLKQIVRERCRPPELVRMETAPS